MKNILNLTALLALAAAARPRMDGTTPPEERRLTAAEWEAARRSALEKEGATDLMNRVIKLEADNYTLRHSKVPDDQVLLTPEEKKAWEAYRALGKPEDIKPKLKQAEQDRTRLEGIEKRETLSAIAEAAGWDAEAFADLDSMAGGLEWTVQEVKDKDGNSVKSVTVKHDGKDVDAAEFAQQRWSKFLPVLVKDGESTEAEDKPSSVPALEPARVPTGGAGGGKGKAYTVADAEKAKADSGLYSM